MRTIKKSLAYCANRKDSVNYIILKKDAAPICVKNG